MTISDSFTIAMSFAIILLFLNASCALGLGLYLARKGVEDQVIGRWRYSPGAWAATAALFGPITVLVFLAYRKEILQFGESRPVPAHKLQGIVLSSALPAALAVLISVQVPVDRCALPDSTSAVTRLLKQSKGMQSVELVSTQTQAINLFSHEVLCRAVVNIQWANGETDKTRGTWYRVYYDKGTWMKEVGGPGMQKREADYQYQLLADSV